MCDLGKEDGCSRPHVIELASLKPVKNQRDRVWTCWPCYSDMIIGHTPLEVKRQRARYEVKKAGNE